MLSHDGTRLSLQLDLKLGKSNGTGKKLTFVSTIESECVKSARSIFHCSFSIQRRGRLGPNSSKCRVKQERRKESFVGLSKFW